jgi:glycosyltransferase involved in cell wall biosynthesis
VYSEGLNAARPAPRISILLISHSYPPVFGGSEVEAQRVSAALIARGHQVTVVCAGGPPMPDVPRWKDPLGVPVRIFARRSAGPWRDRAFALAVAWVLIRERQHYQVVYFLMQGLHLATGVPVARLLRKPIVMKFSGSGLITRMRESWVGRLELRWLSRWAKRVMILNSGIAEEGRQGGLPAELLLWMPNPVDTDEFAPASPEERCRLRAEAGLDQDAPVVVYVGRLAPEKELPSLLDAFVHVLGQKPDALLILVGDGPDRAALVERAAKLGIDSQVRVTGRVSAAAVPQWLQCSDVFTLVSSLEGFPCSLVEAMAAGLPSVVSDIPGNRQLITADVNGWIVPQGDSLALAGEIVKLLSDPSMRARMGGAARQLVVENYATERVIDRYEKLFSEAIG